jgi:erythromycin esterase
MTERAGSTTPLDAFGTIDSMLPNGTVLALGEPTHGSANVSRWKFDVILDLARRGRLAALAFEESYAVGRDVDAALSGAGPGVRVHSAWDCATSIWRTAAIREGLDGLAVRNESLPAGDRVRFFGVDIKKPRLAARALIERGVAAPALEALAAHRDAAVYSDLGPSDVDEIDAACLPATTDPDPQIAAFARQIRRYVDAYLREPDLAGLYRRDEYMARTLLEQLPGEGVTVLWAHNEHVARNPDFFGGPSMGYVLAEELGDRYVPLGVLCGEGECRAVDPTTGDTEYRTVQLPPVREGSTEQALSALGEGVVTVPTAQDGSGFSHPGPRRFIGWQVDSDEVREHPERYEMPRPASDFAALAYFSESRADVSA